MIFSLTECPVEHTTKLWLVIETPAMTKFPVKRQHLVPMHGPLILKGMLCYTVWKNEKFTLTQKFSRQISYLVILLVKSLLSRNFCQKRVRVNFRNFHTVHVLQKRNY